MSLATKYRPKDFSEIVGQDSIVKILQRQIDTDQIKNCYIFAGPSGTGKTTFARALASKINGSLSGLIEIDAASNNGVDNVRSIIEDAQRRSYESKYKVFIIDEAHGLSTQAWQAFLKCIEEPPKFTIFMFCTTDPQKIPVTIVNRCMRFNLQRISYETIRQRLSYIAQCENFVNYEESVDYISRISNGQMRTAISLLETAASYSPQMYIESTIQALGNFSFSLMFDLINNIIDQNEAAVMQIIDHLYNNGSDFKLFTEQFLSFNMDILKYILIGDCSILQIPMSMKDRLDNSINFENSQNYYKYYIDKLLELKNMLKDDGTPKNTLTVVLLQMCMLK